MLEAWAEKPPPRAIIHESCDEHDVAWCGESGESGESGDKLCLAADEAREDKICTDAMKYECTGCRGQLILCRLKHHRFYKSACFRHKTHTPSCKAGSAETQLHYQCKYYMQKYAGCYDFCLSACKTPGCDTFGFRSWQSDTVRIEKRLTLDGTVYVYDVLVYRRGSPRLAIEIMNKHKTEPEKIRRTRHHGIEVVEVHVQDVIEALPSLEESRQSRERGDPLIRQVTLPNILKLEEHCAPCKSKYAEHKRALQAQGFRKAEERAEQNRRPYKRPKYEHGMMRKCPECYEWVRSATCARITRASSGDWWFDENKYYPRQETVAVCVRCAVDCEMCGNPTPLSNALRYGLCLNCNRFS
jgi:hypothetical protein